MATRWRPSDAPRPTLQPIVADVPLTPEEERRLMHDWRLVDGRHGEFLSYTERNRLVLLDYLIINERHGTG